MDGRGQQWDHHGEPGHPQFSFLPEETLSYPYRPAFPGQQQPPTVYHQAQSPNDGSGGFGGPQKPAPTAMPRQCLYARYQVNVAYDVGADYEQQQSDWVDLVYYRCETLDYDYLILATGSHTRGHTPFKGLGTTEETRNALHDFQSEVTNSKTVVIAGAGVTGVETAGELAFEYGREKEIFLIASGPTVLEESPASVSKYALKALENLQVNVRLQTNVKGSAQRPDGRKELMLSSGEKLTTDMYVPAFGLIPNSSYVPASHLNANGSVMVDEFLRVKGAKDVWAIGDVSDVESWQFITCDRQSTHLAKNMISMMNDKAPVP